MGLGRSGHLVPWSSGPLAPWSPGLLVPWSLVPWSPLLVFGIKLLKNYNVHGLVLCALLNGAVVVVVVRVVL